MILNRGYGLHHNHQQQIPWTNPALPLGKPLPPLSPQAWQQKLNNGEVTLNGIIATPQHFDVLLFEDHHLLAVNKPSGLPTLPGGGFMENTLLRLVQKLTPNANPVHRLGRANTGIVLFAKTPQAASNLCAKITGLAPSYSMRKMQFALRLDFQDRRARAGGPASIVNSGWIFVDRAGFFL